MRKIAVSLLASALFFTFAGSIFASETNLKYAVNSVVGTPYKWGGNTVKGFDCSGFILYILNQYDVDLPRTSKAQSIEGTKVSKDDLQPGDLVFFNTFGKGVSHAGIYLGNNEFAHASSSKGVRISKLSDDYYEKRYVTARRVISDETYDELMSKEH